MGTLTRARRIIRNAGFLTGGKIAGDLFTFLFFVAITRMFGQEGIGKYSFAMAFTGFFTILLGLYDFSIKEISQYDGPKEECYGHLFAFRLAVTSFSFAVLSVVVPFLPFPAETKMIILIIGGYQILYKLIGAFLTVYMAYENMNFAAFNDFGLKCTIACVSIAIAYMGGGLVLALGTLPVMTALFLVANYIVVSRKYGRPGLNIRMPEFLRTLKKAFPYYVSAFNFQLTSRVDVLLLGFLLGTDTAGVYNVAFRIVFLFLTFPGLLSITLLPMASRLGLQSRGELSGISNTALNLAILAGLPVSAGLCYIAPQVIALIYGDAFEAAFPVLRLLSWLVLLECLKAVLGVFLVACDRQADRTKAEVIAAVINIAGNLALIPKMGIAGAALATLFSQILLVLMLIRTYARVLGWPHLWVRFVIASSGCMAFYSACNLLGIESIFLIVPVSVVVYLLIMMSFESIRKGEYRFLVDLVKRREVDTMHVENGLDR